MAVYTALGDGEVAGLLEVFGAGLLQGFSPIAEGIENTNYRVTTPATEYVLTVYERASAQQVEAVLQATETLAGRGVPCPRVRRTGAGALVGLHRGRPVSLVMFTPGESVSDPEATQLETLGRTLVGLHRQGAELSLPGRAHDPEVLLPAARRLASRLAAERPGQTELAALVLDECHWQAARLPDPDLPGGLIHTDLFRDNVLFGPGGARVTGLLDFHLAGRGPWSFDLAVVLLDWCWGPRGMDGDRARALLRGYRIGRSLAGSEIGHLPTLLRRAALRYLCLRCERFLLPGRERVVGVCKDPLEFAAKLEALRGAGEAALS